MNNAFNPSNTPNTCLWCGVKLRPVVTERGLKIDIKRIQSISGFTMPQRFIDESTRHYEANKNTFGAHGNGFFHSQACAFEFAIHAAKRGYRFQPRVGA